MPENKVDNKEEKKENKPIIMTFIGFLTIAIAFIIIFQNTYDELLRVSSNTIIGVSIEQEKDEHVDPFELLSEDEKRRLLEEITSNE